VLSGRGLCDALSRVQRSPTDCVCVCSKECDREAPYGEVMTRKCVEAPQE